MTTELKMSGEAQIIELSAIKPYANNVKEHTQEQIELLTGSIKNVGYLQPIVVDENNVILCGHGRYMAALIEKYDTIEVVKISDLTESQKKQYRILDNSLNAMTGFNNELLTVELKQLQDDGIDIKTLAIPEETLKKLEILQDEQLLIEPAVKEETEEEPESEEMDEEQQRENSGIISFVKENDVWLLGRHRLACIDSCKPDKMAMLMNAKKANLLLTDSPYGMNKSEIINDSADIIDYIYKSLILVFRDFCDDDASGYNFGIYPIINKLYDLIVENDFNFVQDLYWLKGVSRNVNNKYLSKIENILYFSKNKNYVFNNHKKHYSHFKQIISDLSYKFYQDCEGDSPQANIRRSQLNGGFYPADGKRQLFNIFQYTNCKGFKTKENKVSHPTMKPVEMLSDFIMQSSNENDIILDMFGGSGSTLIACEETQRNCYMAEIDINYCSVIIERYAAHVKSYDSIFLLDDAERVPYKQVMEERK